MAAVSTFVFLVILIHRLCHNSAIDVLSPGSSLSAEQSINVLRSRNGRFICGFYNISPNASTFSIWFSNVSERPVVWSANPLHPVYSWGSNVKLNFDGSMVLKDYTGQTVWTNNVSSSIAGQAQLLDTGNLIVKGKGDIILWQSFNSPTDTLLPTQRINVTTKLVSTNRLLFMMNASGVLDSLGQFQGSDSTSFMAADWGRHIIRRLTLDYDGNLRLYSLNDNGTWSVTWMAFPQLCKVYGVNGRNGIFIDQSDWGEGCRPKINITCDEEKVKFVHLPNTNFYGLDLSAQRSVSLNFCKQICLSDYKCNGFAYFQGFCVYYRMLFETNRCS
ncbi:hypothetical protein SETIT_4G232900v2 [Setaria italica]|uniref:non-specific serine/threonine protein kinase n=1 Tax=Setaria italica TaxID=4555 RepID=K3Y179_SETIT|nr:hypothetical protein SETIT_4G232900v2 [Setaria italica]